MVRLVQRLVLAIFGFCGLIIANSPFHASSDLITGSDLESNSPPSDIDWQQIVNRIELYVDSVLPKVGSGIGNELGNEVPSILDGFPTAQGFNSSHVPGQDSRPMMVLNMPSFGNWTDSGWQLRFRGSVYRQVDVSPRMVHNFARILLLDPVIQHLTPPEGEHLMRMIRGLFTLPQQNVKLSFQLTPVESGRQGTFTFDAPHATNLEGDFDFLVNITEPGTSKLFLSGGMAAEIQVVDTLSNLSDTGYSQAYLVPTYGLTVVSDIDDVLRVSTIYQPHEGLQNLLTRPFYPWMNMPEVFKRWASFRDMHFHYLTTAPKQMGPSYMDFIFTNYPPGSFDARIINITDIKATTSIRKFLLEKILRTYPHRKFVLLGDSSNFDIMEDYPALAKKYQDRVQCILMRNTTSTDTGHWVPYNTKFFKGLDQKTYMFFRVPDDLLGLDIRNGDCYNDSVPQNLTFGWQGFPFAP